MNIKQTLRSAALGAALLAAGVSTSYGAPATATGTASVSVTVPEVVILNYKNDIVLEFAGLTSAALVEGSTDTFAEVSWLSEQSTALAGSAAAPNTLTNNGSITNIPVVFESNSIVSLRLKDVWAVRGFSPNAKVDVEIAIPTTGQTLTAGATGSTITMSAPKLWPRTSGGSGEGSNKLSGVPFGGLNAGDGKYGDVGLTFDFTNTTASGAHTGGQYTITVTGV